MVIWRWDKHRMKGVDSTIRKTEAKVAAGAKLVVMVKLADDSWNAESGELL